MIATSILNLQNHLEKIKEVDQSDTDLIHLDIMDGVFVENKTNYSELPDFEKKLDIHFMVEDVGKYVNEYIKLNPEYITFHVEVENVLENIQYIKNKNCKVGLSIKPNTDIEKIIPYLSMIDLVLVMTVEPGKGGQKFLNEMISRIDYLKSLQKEYHYVLEVDGGINDETISLCNADIYVVGSYITSAKDMGYQIHQLKELTKK